MVAWTWVDIRIVDAIVTMGDGTIRNIAIFRVMDPSAYFQCCGISWANNCTHDVTTTYTPCETRECR
jgi:hypothetical protein